MSKRPQFGNRFLESEEDVFQHNAWDNVNWNEEHEKAAQKKVIENSEVLLSIDDILKLEEKASEQWDAFYSIHQNRFFKDRHWLFTEFPELTPTNTLEENIYLKSDTTASNNTEITSQINIRTKMTSDLRLGEKYIGEKSTKKILEVGCGVGNTVFPLLEVNNDYDLFVYCCDFSKTAIDILKQSEKYDLSRCKAFTYDLNCEEQETPFPEDSLDIIICIFVLSALHPEKIESAVKRLVKYLKPGGIVLFRDYGRYDMAQLRFKKGRCLGENFYARGDGTRCYFFTQDDVAKIMMSAGLKELNSHIDRRLQVNRGKLLTMYRVWIQGRYQKPILTINKS